MKSTMSSWAHELLNVLSAHQGRDKGIGAKALAALMRTNPRQLRRLISEARHEGLAICGHPTTGYYVPVTAEELAQSCAFLEHRAMHSLQLLSRMRRVSMPALMGQLLLNQS